MAGHDIVVIGASAGGIAALKRVLKELPVDFRAGIFVVIHINPDIPSYLPEILSKAGPLPCVHPRDGDPIEDGKVYVAPPDHHLLLERGRIMVNRGPKENMRRPSIDPLFRSAAYTFGPRVIGVVLSGSLDDGTAGLNAIKLRGGITVVQDPSTAEFPSMPLSAMQDVTIDHVAAIEDLAELLTQLVREPAQSASLHPFSPELEIENRITKNGVSSMDDVNALGTPSVFTCPECHGTLWEIREGQLVRFRCHVGHAFTQDSLESEQSQRLEEVLYAALRALVEKKNLMRKVAGHAAESGRQRIAASYEETARDLEEKANILREMLTADARTVNTPE